MRSFISSLMLCVLVFCLFGCSGDSASENVNVALAPSNNQSNTGNVSTTLPEFTDANAAFAAGEKFLESGETDFAIEAYSQTVKLDPEFAEAYFKLGVAYSLTEVRDVAGEEPTPTPASKDKTKEKKTNSEIAFEKAVASYKKLIAKNSEDDVSHYNLGRSYNKLNEDEDAAKSLRQAVKLKPDDTEYQTELGAILIKLAKYGEAVGALKKALELDPGNTKAEELLADAQAGRKRIGFSVKKDEKKNANSSGSNSTTPNNTNKSTAPANTMKKLPPSNMQ